MTSDPQPGDADFRPDFIIVGSGAGGGPLAARLALAGFKVLVLEAGADHARVPDITPDQATETPEEKEKRLEALEVSLVPSLHGVSTEHAELSWQFFVDHYTKPPGSDPKADKDGKIFYPRAAALGGCTVHNAMITIAGPDSDWDDLADFLRDPSWRGRNMRQYFERLERNEYIDSPDVIPTQWYERLWHNIRWLFDLPFLGLRAPDYSAGRHGFEGWLHTSVADISIGLHDRQLVKMLKAALWKAIYDGIDNGWTFVGRFFKGRITESLDPNHSRTQAESPEGVMLVPIAVCGKKTKIEQSAEKPFVQLGRRSSPREFLLEVKLKQPQNLIIWTECLVTRVLFDRAEPKGLPRAVGVEFLKGAKLYRAHPEAREPATRQPLRVFVRDHGEVILCGGAFNTPQLLMLSGIGDTVQMAKARGKVSDPEPADDTGLCALHGRDGKPLRDDSKGWLRIDSPGVGLNLQDRYEVTVISEMKENFSLLKGAEFTFPKAPDVADPPLREWGDKGTGLYTSNGAVLGILKRSNPHLDQPDLFIFGIPLPFDGYAVGYSKLGPQARWELESKAEKLHNCFTWAILKGQTNNHDGTIRLRSADPLDTPEINFHFFNETSKQVGDDEDPDLLALVEGVKFVRGIADNAHFKVRGEAHPRRAEVPVDSDEQIKEWIRREAWGHHACGTCRMGPENDTQAVLDTRFRVRGVEGLRVVDASIFPKIPGYFIVTNIYMASEKAAEVIIAETRKALAESEVSSAALDPNAVPAIDQIPDSSSYPRELRAAEMDALRERRKQVERVASCSAGEKRAATLEAQNELPTTADLWAKDVTGLGLSGGGIRSATFNLGVLQGLAKGHALRHIDFLSTVSGGGYIGSFLGRFFDRLRQNQVLGNPTLSPPSPLSVEEELVDPESRIVRWLRKHGNYIAPTGEGDMRLNIATFLRNILSMHFVVGMLIFALFGLANAIGYGLFGTAATGVGLLTVGEGHMPLGHLLTAVLGPFFSPWFILCELLILFLVLPRIVGYWLASQDQHERFQVSSLALLFLIGGALLFVGVEGGLKTEPIFLGVALFSSLVNVEAAWRRGRLREAAVGTGGVETQRLRTRNILTYDLSLALAIAGGALAFAVIDTIAHGLQQWLIEKNVSYEAAFAGLIAALAAVVLIARFAAGFFTAEKKGGPPSALVKKLKGQVLAGGMALALFSVPLIFYSFASHVVFEGGSALGTGLLATLFALLISLILTHRQAIAFVNRTSIAQTYSARLARAYLGASNPLRQRPEGSDITEVIAGDDVAAIPDYQPHAAGGPLHLINVTVNQTIDFTSQRGNRDRKGENMAVSCVGVSVGECYHALWGKSSLSSKAEEEKLPTRPIGGKWKTWLTDPSKDEGKKRPTPLKAIGSGPNGEHPLRDESGVGAQRAEMLSLRQWMALSGTAISPSSGASTKLGTALLLGMANLRTGHWWNSSITEATREGFPHLSFFRRFLYLLPELFRTQALIIFEWIARYPGPWERYWFISDGGFFENLAGYELIRRRVPRIIICDASSDAKCQNADLANLRLKAELDFNARIVPFSRQEIEEIPFKAEENAGTTEPETDPRAFLGTLDEICPPLDENGNVTRRSEKHAALFWVHYQCANPPAAVPRRSVLLYLKATLTGDEDLATRYYAATHPDFPHESTGDQFFDEAQWENYRQLGEHIAGPLFKKIRWFYDIPLEQSHRL